MIKTLNATVDSQRATVDIRSNGLYGELQTIKNLKIGEQQDAVEFLR